MCYPNVWKGCGNKNSSNPKLVKMYDIELRDLKQCYQNTEVLLWQNTKFWKGRFLFLPSICSETTLNPSDEICMILHGDRPFSACRNLFDGNSKQPSKPPTAGGRVCDIEHISHYRLSEQQGIDFSDIVVFLCCALGLSSGRMRRLQRAGGAPQRFKRLEVGQPEEPNRYILSGTGLTMH